MEKEQKIFEVLKSNFLRDISLSNLNLLKKSAQDVKANLKNEFESKEEILEAKDWIDSIVQAIAEDLKNDIEKYFNNFNFE